ncbi:MULTISPECIES: bacteriocin immunity protein [Listeria]|uniref:bacteriocin immunity protein n=1 Tax=Listeria TaxID=1637 RepID=UPI000B59126B|nr:MULTISPECIES: bacteriocin immunity protein [Listeria]
MNYQYYTTKEQLNAAIPIVRALSQNLVEKNTIELKNILTKWISEIDLCYNDSLFLNRLILDISNCLIVHRISLSKENSALLKKLNACLLAK